jgi:hypothetical protein
MAQQKCNTAMVTGVYSLNCTGSINLSYTDLAGPFVPFAIQGRFLNELLPDGTPVSKSIGDVLESLGGQPLKTHYLSTAVTINPDCTGTITYHVTGDESGDLDISFLVLDEGKEVRSVATSAGLVSTCNSKLMSRSTSQGQAE